MARIVLPGRKSAFRAGFWPDCQNRESSEIGRPAGRRPAGDPISVLSRQQSGQNPARKADQRPEALLCNVEYQNELGLLQSGSAGPGGTSWGQTPRFSLAIHWGE